MVSDTSSDAPKAMATVVENGRNSSPVMRDMMFSITTMESSTTRPTATVMAAKVKMLSE
jgi:hypothetical protein